MSAAPPVLSNSQTPPTVPLDTPARPPRAWRRAWTGRRVGVAVLIAAALIGGSFALYRAFNPPKTEVSSASDFNAASQYDTLSIPLNEFAQAGQLALDPNRTLNINGQLKVNNSFVIAPTAKPTSAVAGQIYYDKDSDKLAYYNGQGFVDLLGNGNTVTSLGGATGTLVLGNGLAQSSNTLSNTGVLSVQGQSGAVSFTAGPGIAVDGTTLSSTGVLSFGGQGGAITLGTGLALDSTGTLRSTGTQSLTSGSGNLVITNDGNNNLTISSVGGGTGTVTSSGGTVGKIAKFTGAQNIEDSLLSDNGTAVTVSGDLAVTGTLSLGTQLSVPFGGTGAATLAANGVLIGNGTGAITSQVAGGAGLCLISTSGAPTWQACPGGGGGGVSSLNGLSGALSVANATASGSTITINDASTSQKGIAQFNPTNFTATTGTINTVQNINTSAAPTFGQLTLTSSQASAAMLTVNNTNAGATGNLVDLQLNGTSKFAVSPAGALTLSGTVNGQTISSAANFTGTLTVASTATLNGNANIGGTLSTNTLTPTGALTVGATAQSFTLQGNASSTITATNAGSTTGLTFQTPTANVTYRFLTTTAGAYDVCTTAGNCSGVGGGVTTPGGTTNKIAKFTAGQTIADSIITDNGSTVTIGGALAVNTITPSAALTVGATSQNLTMQGATVQLTSTSGGFTNALTFATPSGSNKTITLPNATGTVAVSASGPLTLDASGNLTCPSCVTSGGGGGGVSAVDSLNGLTGALTLANASGAGTTVTINDASTSQKGIAQFNNTNFSASGGIINTIQSIATTAAPTFGQLSLTSSQSTAAMLTVNNTFASASGPLIDLQLNGTSKFSVAPNGNTTIAGTLGVTGNITTSGSLTANSAGITTNLNVSGTSTTNALSVTTDASVGNNVYVGNAIANVNGGSATALIFQTPTANVNYRFLTAAAGTYDVCTTVGNCSGAGSSNTLQAAYNAGNTITSTDNRDLSFTLADTTTDSNFLVNLQCSTSCGSNGRFAVQKAGTDVLTVAPSNGAVTLHNSANSTAAFVMQNALGTQVIAFDTTNDGSALFGPDTTGKHVSINVGTNNGSIDIGATGGNLHLTLTQQSNASALILHDADLVTRQGTNSTTSFQVQNASSQRVFNVDTTNGTATLGQSSALNGKLVFNNSTNANTTTIAAATPASNRTITLPDETGTVCTTGSVCTGYAASSGSANYIQNQNSGDQTGNLRITGTARANTSVQTPVLDTATSVGLAIGNANATSISLGNTSANLLTTIYGQTLAKSTTGNNSVTAFQVQNASGTAAINVDTVNGRVGVGGNIAPAYPLDVTGDINTTTALRIGGTSVCDTTGTTGCIAKSGSGFYIHNQTTVQSANMFIQASDTTAPTVVFEQAASGTADIFDILKNDGTTKFVSVTSAGNFAVANGSTYSLSSNTSGSITSSGSITMTAGGASTWSTSSGNLTVQAATTSTLSLQTGGAGTVSLGNQNSTTINIGAGSNIVRTFHIGDAGTSQAQTITLGSTGGTSATTIQGGTGASAINLTAGAGGSINLTTSSTGNITLTGGSKVAIKPATDNTAAFQVQNAAGGYLINVDTSGNTIGMLFGMFGTGAGTDFTMDTYFASTLTLGGTTATAINIGSSASSTTITTGSTVKVKAATNGTSTFDVQNASSVHMLTADTTHSAVIIGQVASGTTAAAALYFGDTCSNFTQTCVKIGEYGGTDSDKLQLHGAQGVVFTTGYTTPYVAASFNSSGQFGLNTATPSSTFQVNQAYLVSGTVSNSAAGTTVTGSGTAFLSTFQPGDNFTITSSGNVCTVKQITSNTSLVCVSSLASASSGSAYSYTQQTRLSTYDNGHTEVGGTLYVNNPGVADQYSVRVDTADNTLKFSANAVGNTGSGNATDSGNNNLISASKYNSGTGGTINALRIYLPFVQASPSNHVKVAVYSDSSGSPGTLLSSATAPSTVATTGWNTVSLGTTVTLSPNTNYWFAFNVDGSGTNYGYGGATTNSSAYVAMTYSNNFPANFSATSTSSNAYSVYGVYTSITDRSATPSALTINSNNEVLIKPTSNTTKALEVQNAAGSSVFDIDTFNGSVGTYYLDVNASHDANYRLNVGGLVKFYRGTSTATDNLLELYSDVGSTGNLKFKVQANGNIYTDGSTTIGTPADIAEKYPVAEPVEPGDVVIFKDGMKLGKTTTPYDSRLAGVVSTDPGVVLSGNTDGAALALKGRVPVKVTAENGAIHAGDPLTASANHPGYAMKATAAGTIIGTALESLSSGTDTIQVFLNLGYSNPSQNLQGTTQFQDVSVQGKLTAADLNVTGSTNLNDLTVTGTATIANLTVSNLVTAALTVNGHIVTGGGTPTATAGNACSAADVTISGTDTAGLVTVTTAPGCSGPGNVATIDFAKAFGATPRVTLTPANANASALKTYIDSSAITTNSFTIATPTAIDGSLTYRWYYQVLQ
jgi:hypothetical protein